VKTLEGSDAATFKVRVWDQAVKTLEGSEDNEI